jgi:Cys-Gly metallodipeptidase DUG1
MEESGSEGLDQVIFDESGKYFKDVDCCCISDNYWLGTTKPCLTYIIQLKCRYGLRGVQTFQLVMSFF